MKGLKNLGTVLTVLGLLCAFPQAGLAAVFFQCPTLTDPLDPTTVVYDGVFHDDNGDGQIRAQDGEIGNPLYPTQVCIHLAAGDGFTNMTDGRLQYIFGFNNVTSLANPADALAVGELGANFPAPTINVKQGDMVYLSLTNVGMKLRPDLFDPHTVHWHGFPNAASVFDGVPDDSLSIKMGATLTYFYKVVEAGTFMYHCHVEAPEHMQMGMIGNLYVTPAQDGTTVNYNGRDYTKFAYNDIGSLAGDGHTGYNEGYPIQIAGFDPIFHDTELAVQVLDFVNMEDTYPMLNGRGYPGTIDTAVRNNTETGGPTNRLNALITATAGDRILLRLSSLSTTSFHTITVPGMRMTVVGNGSSMVDPPYMTNSVTLGGGESIDVILDTNGADGINGTADDIAPGTYFLYTTQLDHLNNNTEDSGGMMTEIVISPAG